MIAVEVASFGEPDVLEVRDLPDPAPSAGQVLVDASASDVLFVDTLIRAGRGVGYFPIRPPYIPGNGVGGTVIAVGDGVDESWLRRRVVAHTGGPGGSGGYAQLVAADVQGTVALPDSIELNSATALLHDGTTAMRIIEMSAITPDDRVLILGAAGGMGILLVQLLTALGASVVGTAGGEIKQDVVSDAGAQAAVDYGRDDWTETVLDATGGTRPTVVLDGVGGQAGRQAFGLIADGGRFSAHGSSSGSFAPIDADDARRRQVTVTAITDLQYDPGHRSRLMHAALQATVRGEARPLIGQTFALAEASKAHRAIEERTAVAKTLLVHD